MQAEIKKIEFIKTKQKRRKPKRTRQSNERSIEMKVSTVMMLRIRARHG